MRKLLIDRKTGTVKDKSLTVKLKKHVNQAFYGSYQANGKKQSGWFREKDFVKQPSYEHEMTAARVHHPKSNSESP